MLNAISLPLSPNVHACTAVKETHRGVYGVIHVNRRADLGLAELLEYSQCLLDTFTARQERRRERR